MEHNADTNAVTQRNGFCPRLYVTGIWLHANVPFISQLASGPSEQWDMIG